MPISVEPTFHIGRLSGNTDERFLFVVELQFSRQKSNRVLSMLFFGKAVENQYSRKTGPKMHCRLWA